MYARLTLMKVIETIQSTSTDTLNMRINEPVEVKWCDTSDPAEVLASVASILAESHRDATFVETLAIRIEF